MNTKQLIEAVVEGANPAILLEDGTEWIAIEVAKELKHRGYKLHPKFRSGWYDSWDKGGDTQIDVEKGGSRGSFQYTLKGYNSESIKDAKAIVAKVADGNLKYLG